MFKLKHRGILVLPAYKAKGYTIFYGSQAHILKDKEEEMLVHWVKKLGTPYAEDPVFKKNFFMDFCKELGIGFTEEINIDQVKKAVEAEKLRINDLSKEEKKALAEGRKALRDNRKNLYGYAEVDKNRIEIANYLAEPSCIFMGRGQHPLRGKWKEGPREESITLNLSPDAPRPQGKWMKIVWEPKKMYVAKWVDKLSGKVKYVWLSDSWGKKQQKEKAKFDKAILLEKNMETVQKLILDGMKETNDSKTQKIAAVCYLIWKTNMRVGDEKDPDEADTVGAITLRPEHIKIGQGVVNLDFLGKDSVHWTTSLSSPEDNFIRILKENETKDTAYFDGLVSKDIANFLGTVQKGLTAKVFRTYTATKTMKRAMASSKNSAFENEDLQTEKWKKMRIKMNILEASWVCFHKRARPKNFDEMLKKRDEKIARCQERVEEAIIEKADPKRMRKLDLEVLEAKLERMFYYETSEWNLNTTLKSYIDPRVVKEACDKIDLPYEKIYSQVLLKKFSWALTS